MESVARRPRFGAVEEIRGSEFVQKVTNAGPGIHVVVHLYKDGHAASVKIGQYLTDLASKYPSTKFIRIVSTGQIVMCCCSAAFLYFKLPIAFPH